MKKSGVFAINYYNDNVNIIEHTAKGLDKYNIVDKILQVCHTDSNKIQTFKNTGR